MAAKLEKISETVLRVTGTKAEIAAVHEIVDDMKARIARLRGGWSEPLGPWSSFPLKTPPESKN